MPISMMENPATSHLWNRLILVGFMGAGKSTIGALLATRLRLSFIDTDAVIEQQAGTTIAQIFEEHGEANFRLKEAQVINDLLMKSKVVIALGGGALETSSTRRLLSDSQDTCVIYLEAPLTTMLDRCRETSMAASSVSVRPLLHDQRALAQRHAHRLEHYRAATLTVATEGVTVEAVLEQLLHRLMMDPRAQSLLPQSMSNQQFISSQVAGR